MNVCIDPNPNPFPNRGEAIFFAVIAIAIMAWLYIRPFKWLPHRVRQLLLICCYAAMPVAMAFIFVPESFYDQLRSTIVCRYQAWIEPNYLNRVARFYERNVEIVLPTTDDGVIITDETVSDVIVELAKNGRLSINNAILSGGMLRVIFTNRVSKYGSCRVFIRADKDSSAESRVALVQLLQELGCRPLYFVVASSSSRKATVEYRAIPWPAEQ